MLFAEPAHVVYAYVYCKERTPLRQSRLGRAAAQLRVGPEVWGYRGNAPNYGKEHTAANACYSSFFGWQA